MENEPSLFDKLGPKTSYYFGLGTGLTAFFVVGFFVVLGILVFGWEIGPRGSGSAQGDDFAQVPPTAQPTPTIELSENDWVRGSKDADITIVEYSDFDCPFCQRHHDTMNQIMDEYAGKVKWVYRHFPLTSLHPDAEAKANAAECAGDIGGNDTFWTFADQIFEQSEGGTVAELAGIAADVGVNKSKFEKCLNDKKFADEVTADAQDAIKNGGTGTPYNVIISGDQQIPVNGAVPFEQFKSILDSLVTG